MILILEILSFLLSWSYAFVFFWIVKTFLPLRKNWFMRVTAFLVCIYLSNSIIYSNDFYGLLGTMLLFFAYILVFYQGRFIEKISVLLVFYPVLIAINYLMIDISGKMFFAIVQTSHSDIIHSEELMIINNVFYVTALFCRLLFWVGAWLILHKFLAQITSNLTMRMWLIVDLLMLASFVATSTIIYFAPENAVIVYAICGASIFSSFGCMYLASYICISIRTDYRAQELEMQQNYYKDRMKDEERVRSVYHDLKNHLLLLQNQVNDSEVTNQMITSLQKQIMGYENYYHTGNEFLDIIVRDKARIAEEANIDFSVIIHLENSDFIVPLDISTIFGNALDNAIEASMKLPPIQRLITVKAKRLRDMLIIVIENNMEKGERKTFESNKKDNFFHGFGLSNIKKAVEKYDGQCTIKFDKEGIFVLKIIIPIPKK